jgi:phage shock protein C
MFCTQCGTHLSDDARYCTACGRATFSESAVQMTYAIDTPARRLFRIPARKKIAGVCAGFAEYFGLDVTLVRLIWVGMSIMPPSIGVIGYILSWIVLPVE